MPIYEYRCEACGHADEHLQKVSEAPLTVCPACGKPEYRKQLKATYKAPARCTRYCCGWLGFEGEPDSAPNLKCIIGGGTGEQDKEVLKSFQTEERQKK